LEHVYSIVELADSRVNLSGVSPGESMLHFNTSLHVIEL